MVSFGIQEDEQNMDSWKHQTQRLSQGIMNLCTSSVYIAWEGPHHLWTPTASGVCVCMCVCVCVCARTHTHAHPLLFSYVQPFVMPWTVAPLGSSIHGIFQANMLKQVAISFSRESSWSRDQTCISWVSCVGKWIFLSLCHLESPSIKPKYTVSYLNAGAFCHFILTMLKYNGCSKYASKIDKTSQVCDSHPKSAMVS